MCNFILEEDKNMFDFNNMNKINIRGYQHNLNSVQQIRSYYINIIEKEDVWDSKNAFRNHINRLILRENIKWTTLEELEIALVNQTKDWIAEVNPKPH